MRYSQDHKAQTHQRIIEEASARFRRDGIGATGLQPLMKALGLTHGGFYGHFRSKDDLIAQMLEHRCQRLREAPEDLDLILDTYLSPALCDDPARGCHIPVLAPAMGQDMTHHSPEARAAMTESIRVQIGRLETVRAGAQPDAADSGNRGAAIRNWAAMIGAVVLARASDDRALAEEILAEVRARVKADLGGAG